MATLAELARAHTQLDAAQLAHLQRLVASWGPLADLCFSDLLLFVPVDGTDHHVVVGQVRPTTNQTVYRQDLVGEVFLPQERPLVAEAWATGARTQGEASRNPSGERIRVLCIPVRCRGEVIGVVSRESATTIGRQPGELERTYLRVFDCFADMIEAGTFPFAADDPAGEESPRVGDGTLVLDADGRVEYASPNAVSALHKVGLHANAEGMRLGELGLEEVGILSAMAMGAPVTEEIERGQDVSVLLRCLPMLDGGKVIGALVLLRDVSELRRRDRLLNTMDATIREIHHRVKNNLQTISSLLGLQGRRLSSPEAKAALEESVRRIRSIALVHETLSRETGDDVSFNEIVRPLVRMVEESLLSPERPVRVTVEGDAGSLPASVATPLAVVLTELVQNAVDHGYPEGSGDGADGSVVVSLHNDGEELALCVSDEGVGLAPGFRLEDATGLGLSIVRSLVISQIEGSIEMRANPAGGTVVEVRVPLRERDDESRSS
ncbi:MAG: histidine kinase N-terminal domain-containing protein [Acidobacteria bacterium]|nr:histidine kinase N-terminal domain-containing protein [Acidobacteriota bacterium]